MITRRNFTTAIIGAAGTAILGGQNPSRRVRITLLTAHSRTSDCRLRNWR